MIVDIQLSARIIENMFQPNLISILKEKAKTKMKEQQILVYSYYLTSVLININFLLSSFETCLSGE